MTRSTLSRTWQLWERSPNPPPIRLQPRDTDLIEAVFRHRFIQPRHAQALLGGSDANLKRRLKLLWEHRYLERPKAIRPTKVLTEQIVYGLGKKGARYLEHAGRAKGIGRLDWTDEPKKQRGLLYVEHQLDVATFFVALRLACDRLGHRLHWRGHSDRERYKIRLPDENKSFLADAYFILERSDGKQAGHFLELDRGSAGLADMHDKFARYFRWWKLDERRLIPIFERGFRVLVVTHDASHMKALRRVAVPIGREGGHAKTWKGLLFSHLDAFDLGRPEQILDPIFRYADEDALVSLLG